MPDAGFSYRIAFTADTSGAQAAQAAFAGITEKADKLATSAGQAGVATDRFVDATGKLRDASGRFVSTGQSVDEVKKKLSDAEHEADHFFESLKAGVNIDLGHRFVEALADVPAKMREIVEEGVRVNAQVETLKIGLAGAFRSSDPDRFGDFHSAEVAATEAFSAIQAKANELGLSIHSLAEGLSINMHGLAEGGVTDIKQQIDLIATLNQAAQAKGLDGARAGRDIIDLLQGRANRTLFGAELGIRDEDVKMAREAGKLYEFLSDKLSAYKEGGQAAASTFAAAEQRLRNETEQLYATVSRPIFEALKDALNDINNQLKDGKTAEELKGLGYNIAEVAKDGATLLKWGIEMAPVLFRVAEGVGAVSLAIALLKLPGIIASLGQKSLAWLRNAEAVQTETAALVENTAAAEANAAAKVASGGAGAAAGAGGFLSTAGAGAAIGGGLVALEAGYALIKLWEAAKNEQIDALHAQSEAGSAAVLAAQKQIDAADTAEKKEKARLDIVKQIADLQEKIAANQPGQQHVGRAYGHANWSGDADQVPILQEQLRDLQHQLATLEGNAGKHLGDKEDDTRGRKAIDAFHGTDEYQLEQAKLSGNQDDADAYGFQIEVKKLKEKLEPLHLPEKLAEAEAKAEALANDLAKQRKGLNAELDRLDSQVEKTKDAAGIKADLDAKQRELAGALPAGTGTDDLAAVGATIKGLPEGSQAEIDQKEKLADLLKEIIALRKDEATATRSEEAAAKKAADDAKAEAAARKSHDDALAAEKVEVEILRARAIGHEDVARKLERERDLQREITRLMQENLTYQEAVAVATDRVNLKDDAAYQKRDAAEARHEAAAQRRDEREENRHRRGERDTFTVRGFSDPDRGSGLHTGGLTTGNLGGSGQSSAADALAAAPSYVPSFPAKPLFAPGQNPLASLFAGGPLSSVFGASPAGVGFGPAISALGPVGSPSSALGSAGGQDGATGGDNRAVTDSARQAARATRETTDAARELSGQLSALFRDQKREQEDLRRELENIKSQVENRA